MQNERVLKSVIVGVSKSINLKYFFGKNVHDGMYMWDYRAKSSGF